jgi:hypothetical protein
MIVMIVLIKINKPFNLKLKLNQLKKVLNLIKPEKKDKAYQKVNTKIINQTFKFLIISTMKQDFLSQ